jgi:iron complex outermembrane receptor protein
MNRSLITGHNWMAAAFASVTLCTGSHAAGTSERTETVLQELVITASPIAHDADRFATIVDSVDRSQILRQGGANLVDALANTPGVTGTSFAAGASRPVIRGFDANRVRVLEDGVGSFDVSDVGPDHGVPIDPLSAQRIEVVRGAATLRYGSQAIGGVVNAINSRVPTALPEQPFSGDASASYASSARAGEGTVLFDARAGQFAFHADGFARHTSNYDIPGPGKQSNSFFTGDGFSMGGSFFFGDSRVGAAVVHYDANYGIPNDSTYIAMKQTKGMLRSSLAIGAGAFQTLSVEGGYADYEHKERESDRTVLSTFKDREWDARGEGVFGELGPLSGAAVGIQLQHKSFSALGDGASYLLPTATRTAAAFAFAEAPINERAHLETGVRVEHVRIRGTPTSGLSTTRTFTPISGSLGVVWNPVEQIGVGAMLSSAARAPAQTELFARGPHDGPGTFETGDAMLDVERVTSLEGTLRLRYSAMRHDTSVWIAKFNNYIYGHLTGRTCNDDGSCVAGNSQDFKELNFDQRAATFRGFETKLTAPLLDNAEGGQLNGELFADYVRATLNGGGGNVPRIPPWHVGGALHWTRRQGYAGLSLKYSAPQNQTSIAESRTAGFTSVDAYVGWQSMGPDARFEVSLIGRNLTDSVQRNAIAINKDSVTLPGRDLRLVVRATF